MTTAMPVADRFSREEKALARQSCKQLAVLARSKGPITARFSDSGQDATVELPPLALRYLMEIMNAVESGRSVTITPSHDELTTQQAADLLGVSRPFLIQLLDKETIPFRMVGSHRRIRYEDAMGYKEAIDAKRRRVLDRLASEAQELDMGY